MTRWRVRRRRNGDADYANFRCGLDFATIRRELQGEQTAAKERGEHMFVTRRTVLGRMHYYKLQAFDFAGGNLVGAE